MDLRGVQDWAGAGRGVRDRAGPAGLSTED